MKLLAAADLHLGRALGGVPPQWADQYSPRRAWNELIKLAIGASVDAVVLAGDVVDRENQFFEAYGALRRGVARLSDAGIPVIAVAGNHDTTVLPELAATLDGLDFVLLGVGGKWESHDITGADGTKLRLYGWSFPAQHHRQSPFADALDAGNDAPAAKLGLLHCDYAVASSVYAPVTGNEFEDSAIPHWILGHIHVPQRHSAGSAATVHYPGSLQGLDAGETGTHGALLIEYDAEATPTVSTVPIGRLAYLKIDLPANDLECSSSGLTLALREAIEVALAADGGIVEAVVIDLKISGESAHTPGEFRAIVDTFRKEPFQDLGNRHVTIRKQHFDVRPLPEEFDLHEIAGGTDLLGTLAQALVALEDGDLSNPIANDMIDEVTRNVRRAVAGSHFEQLNVAAFDGDEIVRHAIAKGYELLRDLHDQRETLQGAADA